MKINFSGFCDRGILIPQPDKFTDSVDETCAALQEGPCDELQLARDAEEINAVIEWIKEHRECAPKLITFFGMNPLEEVKIRTNAEGLNIKSWGG